MLSEKELFEFIHQYVMPRKNYISQLDDPNLLFGECQQVLTDNGSLENVMLLLEQHRDVRASIRSNHLDNQVWMRDAREVDLDVQSVDPWENYAILGLNYLAGLNLLLRHHYHDKDVLLKQRAVMQTAKLYLQEFSSKVNQQYAKECTARLLLKAVEMAQEYCQISLASAHEYIETAKEFANMQSMPCTVVTISQREGNPMTFEVEIPIPVFQGKLLEYYKDYKTAPWYKALPNWQQELVSFAIVRLKAGAMIPTQLRRYLPGPRNFYQRLLLQLDDNDQLQILLRCYHSGTPAHMFADYEHSLDATEISLKSMYELIGAGILHVNTLLSPLKMRPDDYNAHNQVAQILNNHEIYHSNVPLNGFRKWVGVYNNIEQMNIAVDALGGSRAKQNEQNWFCIIKSLYQFYVANCRMSDDENSNLRILSVFAYLLTLLKDPKDHMAIFNCLSGKDRTNILMIFASGIAMVFHALKNNLKNIANDETQSFEIRKSIVLSHILNNHEFEDNLKANSLQIAQTGHCRLLAGGIGATRGCAQIKSESFSAVPETYKKEWRLLLFGSSAKYNNVGPKKSFANRIRKGEGEDLYEIVVLKVPEPEPQPKLPEGVDEFYDTDKRMMIRV